MPAEVVILTAMERREGERDFALLRIRLPLSTTAAIAISLALERDWLDSFFVGELDDFFFREAAEFSAFFDVTVFLVVAYSVGADVFFFKSLARMALVGLLFSLLALLLLLSVDLNRS